MNYPRLWQLLPQWGVTPAHTLALGCGVITAFFTGLLIMLWRADYKLSLIMLLGVLSPATFLGIERGNIDLFVFFLVSVSVSLLVRYHIMSFIIALAAFSLKIFPIFSLVILVRLNTKKVLLLSAMLCAFVAVYTFIYMDDLIQIRNGTPASMNKSYGMNVFWMALATFNSQAGYIFKYIISFSVTCWLTFCLLILSGKGPVLFATKTNNVQSKYLDYFRAGSSIYCFTFLIGNNWDYRLIFLLFTLPQLLLWSQSRQTALSKLARLTLACIFISQWYLVISNLMNYSFPFGESIAYLLDQLAKWIVFFSLSYLLSSNISFFFTQLMRQNNSN